MTEKWLLPDEYIVLEGKAWTTIYTPIGPGSSKSKVFLTNKRLFGKDAWTRLKMFDFHLSNITNIEIRSNYLRIDAKIKGKSKRIGLRLKDLDDSWEWMIKESIKSLKD